MLSGAERFVVNAAEARYLVLRGRLADAPEGAPRWVLVEAGARGLALQRREAARRLRRRLIALGGPERAVPVKVARDAPDRVLHVWPGASTRSEVAAEEEA